MKSSAGVQLHTSACDQAQGLHRTSDLWDVFHTAQLMHSRIREKRDKVFEMS